MGGRYVLIEDREITSCLKEIRTTKRWSLEEEESKTDLLKMSKKFRHEVTDLKTEEVLWFWVDRLFLTQISWKYRGLML